MKDLQVVIVGSFTIFFKNLTPFRTGISRSVMIRSKSGCFASKLSACWTSLTVVISRLTSLNMFCMFFLVFGVSSMRRTFLP